VSVVSCYHAGVVNDCYVCVWGGVVGEDPTQRSGALQDQGRWLPLLLEQAPHHSPQSHLGLSLGWPRESSLWLSCVFSGFFGTGFIKCV